MRKVVPSIPLNSLSGSTSSTMEITCMSVMSEGGEEPIGIPRAGRTGALGSTNGIWTDTSQDGITMYAASYSDGNVNALSHCVSA